MFLPRSCRAHTKMTIGLMVSRTVWSDITFSLGVPLVRRRRFTSTTSTTICLSPPKGVLEIRENDERHGLGLRSLRLWSPSGSFGAIHRRPRCSSGSRLGGNESDGNHTPRA